jgi:hypothetical protein
MLRSPLMGARQWRLFGQCNKKEDVVGWFV